MGRTQSPQGRAHGILPDEVEQALLNDPIVVYTQQVEGEVRYVYYGEADAGRMVAVVLTERDEKIRVITAYDLDASQKRDYLLRRMGGNGS